MSRFTGSYPANWRDIARGVKDRAGWRCIRCSHPHDPASGHCLTVHHLDNDKSNVEWWNLVALCQKCHLRIQGKVIMSRPWILPHSEWFKPYVAGYYARSLGLPDDPLYVMANMEQLIRLGQRGGEEKQERQT